jgi:hypothetical protein
MALDPLSAGKLDSSPRRELLPDIGDVVESFEGQYRQVRTSDHHLRIWP